MASLFILCATLLAGNALALPQQTQSISPIEHCTTIDPNNDNFCLQCDDQYRKMYRTDIGTDFCVMAPADSYIMNFLSPSDNSTLMCVVQDSTSGVISAKNCSDIGSDDTIADFTSSDLGYMGDLLWGQDNGGSQVRFFNASNGGDKSGFCTVCEPTSDNGLACSSDFTSRSSTSDPVTSVDLSDPNSPTASVLTFSDDTGSLTLVSSDSDSDNIITNIEIDHVQPEQSTSSS